VPVSSNRSSTKDLYVPHPILGDRQYPGETNKYNPPRAPLFLLFGWGFDDEQGPRCQDEEDILPNEDSLGW
jgi:hypothetical protein